MFSQITGFWFDVKDIEYLFYGFKIFRMTKYIHNIYFLTVFFKTFQYINPIIIVHISRATHKMVKYYVRCFVFIDNNFIILDQLCEFSRTMIKTLSQTSNLINI